MLKWDYFSKGEYTPDGFAKTDVGDLHLCCRRGRVYKDGTYQYSFWISVPGGESTEVITVAKVRGHLADAQAKAEEFAQNLLESLTALAETKEKPELVVVHTMDELKTYIENKGWKVADCGFSNGEVEWEISQYSPAGEDFVFYIQHSNDVEEAVSLLKKYAYDFDEDEHIEVYIEARKNGLAGVPSTRELVEDAEAIQEMLDELADGVNWCEQSTIGEIVKTVNGNDADDLFVETGSCSSSEEQVSALLGEINNLHHEIQGLLAYDEEKVPDVEKRLFEVLTEFHQLAPEDELYFKMCDIYCFDAETEETQEDGSQFYDYPTKEDLLAGLHKTEE